MDGWDDGGRAGGWMIPDRLVFCVKHWLQTARGVSLMSRASSKFNFQFLLKISFLIMGAPAWDIFHQWILNPSGVWTHRNVPLLFPLILNHGLVLFSFNDVDFWLLTFLTLPLVFSIDLVFWLHYISNNLKARYKYQQSLLCTIIHSHKHFKQDTHHIYNTSEWNIIMWCGLLSVSIKQWLTDNRDTWLALYWTIKTSCGLMDWGISSYFYLMHICCPPVVKTKIFQFHIHTISD